VFTAVAELRTGVAYSLYIQQAVLDRVWIVMEWT
jgi:hypothetical protein